MVSHQRRLKVGPPCSVPSAFKLLLYFCLDAWFETAIVIKDSLVPRKQAEGGEEEGRKGPP